MEPYASVIILTRNGMPLFQRCLEGVLGQETEWPFEVIVVDSSSTDGTWELARSRADRAVQIKPADFNHGTTRNYGAGLARGQFLVFLVQDAIPADGRWLTRLVEACAPDGVAGSYSRQVVRPESGPITHFLCNGTTPTSLVAACKSIPLGQRLEDLSPAERLHLASFDDVSSCLKRLVWSRYPFADLRYGEDIEWGKRILQAGWSIAYDPTSIVLHSHDRPPIYFLKRAYADHNQAAELFDYVMIPSAKIALKSFVRSILRAWTGPFRRNLPLQAQLRFVAQALAYCMCVTIGQYIGPRVARQARDSSWAQRLDGKLRVGV